MRQDILLRRHNGGMNSEISLSFSLISFPIGKVREINLFCNLLVARKISDKFMLFSMVLRRSEMLSLPGFEPGSQSIFNDYNLYVIHPSLLAQSAGTVEYTDCTSAEG